MKKFSAETVLLSLIAFSSVLGQFARFSTPVGDVNWHEIAMGVLIMKTIYSWPTTWLKILPAKTFKLAISWLVWILLVTLANSYFDSNRELLINGGAYWLRLCLYFAFVASLWILKTKKVISTKQVIWGVIAWLAMQMLLGLGQYLFYPDTRVLFYLGWDDHLNRAFGTLFDPGYFGLMMVVGVLLTVYKLSTVNNRTLVVLLAMFMLLLAVSFSRASYLALVVGVLILGLQPAKRRWLLLIPLLVLTLVLIPKDGGGEGQKLLRTRSIAERQEIATRHVSTFPPTEWLYGRGWYYQSAVDYHGGEDELPLAPQHSQAVDNAFLHVLLSSGVIGLTLFLTNIAYWLYCLRAETVYIAIWAAVLVHSMFSTAVFYAWVMLLLAVLTIAFFTSEKPRSNQKREQS